MRAVTCIPLQVPLTTSPTKAKVLIVHRWPVIRIGLARLIEGSGRFQSCAETDDAPTARHLFLSHQPQLVLLGLTLRHGNGLQLIKDFRKLDPKAQVMVFSAREDALWIHRAL